MNDRSSADALFYYILTVFFIAFTSILGYQATDRQGFETRLYLKIERMVEMLKNVDKKFTDAIIIAVCLVIMFGIIIGTKLL